MGMCSGAKVAPETTVVDEEQNSQQKPDDSNIPINGDNTTVASQNAPPLQQYELIEQGGQQPSMDITSNELTKESIKAHE